MRYIEVATLRENLLEMVRGGEAMADIENALDAYVDEICEIQKVISQPEQSNHRAELIQLTAAALTGLTASNKVFGVAEYAVGCAQAALDIINKK